MPLKGPVQITFRIPDKLCNLHNSMIRILQQLLRLLDLIVHYIFDKGHARFLLEQPA